MKRPLRHLWATLRAAGEARCDEGCAARRRYRRLDQRARGVQAPR